MHARITSFLQILEQVRVHVLVGSSFSPLPNNENSVLYYNALFQQQQQKQQQQAQ